METRLLHNTQTPAAKQAEDDKLQHQKLRQAAAGFESLFLTYMLKAMRSTVPSSGLLGENQETKMLQSMLDEKIAIQVSDSGGLGLGENLYRQLATDLDKTVHTTKSPAAAAPGSKGEKPTD